MRKSKCREPLSVKEHKQAASLCMEISNKIESVIALIENRKQCSVCNIAKLIKMHNILLCLRADLSDVMQEQHRRELEIYCPHRTYFPMCPDNHML